jgi:hypothetical protein
LTNALFSREPPVVYCAKFLKLLSKICKRRNRTAIEFVWKTYSSQTLIGMASSVKVNGEIRAGVCRLILRAKLDSALGEKNGFPRNLVSKSHTASVRFSAAYISALALAASRAKVDD